MKNKIGLLDILNAKEITIVRRNPKTKKIISETKLSGLKVLEISDSKNSQEISDVFSMTFTADNC